MSNIEKLVQDFPPGIDLYNNLEWLKYELSRREKSKEELINKFLLVRHLKLPIFRDEEDWYWCMHTSDQIIIDKLKRCIKDFARDWPNEVVKEDVKAEIHLGKEKQLQLQEDVAEGIDIYENVDWWKGELIRMQKKKADLINKNMLYISARSALWKNGEDWYWDKHNVDQMYIDKIENEIKLFAWEEKELKLEFVRTFSITFLKQLYKDVKIEEAVVEVEKKVVKKVEEIDIQIEKLIDSKPISVPIVSLESKSNSIMYNSTDYLYVITPIIIISLCVVSVGSKIIHFISNGINVSNNFNTITNKMNYFTEGINVSDNWDCLLVVWDPGGVGY